MSTNEKKTVGGIKGIDWKRYALDFCGYACSNLEGEEAACFYRITD